MGADVWQLELGAVHGETEPTIEANRRCSGVAPYEASIALFGVLDARLEKKPAEPEPVCLGERGHAAYPPVGIARTLAEGFAHDRRDAREVPGDGCTDVEGVMCVVAWMRALRDALVWSQYLPTQRSNSVGL